MSYLSDDERRILLAALRREKEFCSRQLTNSKECVKIVQSLERKFQYDRFEQEIRDKAIEEFAKKIWSWCFEHGRKERINGVKEIVIGLDSVIGGIEKIIEQMKEVREWEKRISFEAGGDEEDYATKCNTCKHSCTCKNESDVLFYSLKECRYEPAKESSR